MVCVCVFGFSCFDRCVVNPKKGETRGFSLAWLSRRGRILMIDNGEEDRTDRSLRLRIAWERSGFFTSSVRPITKVRLETPEHNDQLVPTSVDTRFTTTTHPLEGYELTHEGLPQNRTTTI